ncbi:SCO1860 family LAETG-anchored protein [Streptomyces viridochromogenes]|uniref:Putative Secreted protein n=1 Tax=Streptomyces viridochromogenes Tue57 TaxID=1160705 RepID=L8PK77_STRVR|nr:SCO1860 family LAETG-anchored protein [Streptomyces viridochromogenes]ELS56634.1 putative Secreted protein [Streptomyces viridochromogenes Tue57]
MTTNSALIPSARRLAALAVSGFLLAGPAAAGEATATPATDPSKGSATAVAFRAELDVSGLTGTVPLHASLNEVHAPATAQKKTLDIDLDLDTAKGDLPVNLLKAEVARAKADVAKGRSRATTHLVRARVHVPGLPVLPVVEVEEVTAAVTCVAGQKPTAEAHVLGPLTVLGKSLPVADSGTPVEVPNVGTVRLSLAGKETTSSTAAATSIQLQVSVDPLNLGVEKVEGTVTLAQATCRSGSDPVTAAGPGRSAPHPQTVSHSEEEGLAKTGGNGLTPYVLAVGAVLVATGAGAVALARRRTRSHR